MARGARRKHVHSRECGHALTQRDILWIILTELEEFRMSNQEQLDDLSGRVTALNDSIAAGVANVRQDIADLKSQPGAEQLDFSSLENSLAGLQSTADSVAELDSENPPVPAPEPTAEA